MVQAAGTMKPSKLVGGNSVVEVAAADLLLLCSVKKAEPMWKGAVGGVVE